MADVYIDDRNVFMLGKVNWYKIEKYILSLDVPEVQIVTADEMAEAEKRENAENNAEK